MPPDNEKIDEMHGMLHAMKPMLEDVRDTQKGFDVRLRATEIVSGAHAVKIDRIQSDLDGLGRKIRYTAPVQADSKWGTIFALLALVPPYWHLIASGLILVTAVGVKMWGK